jgi:hypothetical protein
MLESGVWFHRLELFVVRHLFVSFFALALGFSHVHAVRAQNLPDEVAGILKDSSDSDLTTYLRTVNMELVMATGDVSQQREIIAYALVLRKDDMIETMGAASMVDGQFRDAVDFGARAYPEQAPALTGAVAYLLPEETDVIVIHAFMMAPTTAGESVATIAEITGRDVDELFALISGDAELLGWDVEALRHAAHNTDVSNHVERAQEAGNTVLDAMGK